jgi:hypothetical protein
MGGRCWIWLKELLLEDPAAILLFVDVAGAGARGGFMAKRANDERVLVEG